MKRREFVQIIAAGSVLGSAHAFGQNSSPTRSAVVVRSGSDRGGRRQPLVGGSVGFDAKVSTADSAGGVFIFENTTSTKGGPRRHVHHDQEEWFYVLQGEYVIECGQEQFFLSPGDSIYLPRRVPHAWALISDGVGKMVGAFHPAGSFEEFVAETAKLGGRPTQELMERHGMSFVGPAIDVANLKRPK